MGMTGQYLRVTPAELERAVKDPDWLQEHVEEVLYASGDGDLAPSLARGFSTEKMWDLLRHLLERAGCPVNLVHGEEDLVDDDWGYGPPRLLRPDRVRLAAESLGTLPYDRLIAGVTPYDLDAGAVYPHGWDEPDALEWGREIHRDLTAYVGAAADSGDALLVWIA
jgi:hypothetical protein